MNFKLAFSVVLILFVILTGLSSSAQFVVTNNAGCNMDIMIFARDTVDSCDSCGIVKTCLAVAPSNACSYSTPNNQVICGVRAVADTSVNRVCVITNTPNCAPITDTCNKTSGCNGPWTLGITNWSNNGGAVIF